MKKIFLVLLFAFSLVLVACEEITDDYNNKQKPSIELTNTGELVHTYDEDFHEEITFTVKLNKFAENEITDYEINWYLRGQLFVEYKNLKTITQEVKTPGSISVKVEVSFKFEGKNVKLEDDAVIVVERVATKIVVSNSIEANHVVSVKMGENSVITFEGTITGNLKHDVINWVIQRQSGNEPITVKVIEAEIVITNNVGKAKLEAYDFARLGVGNYIVTLQTGEGTGQDANKTISNSTHINVNFGDFEITTLDNKVMSGSNIKAITLRVNELDSNLVGTGEYVWYLDGTEVHRGLELVHDNINLGGYLYQVKFVPSVLNELKEVEKEVETDIETDPFLVVNGIEADNEDDLLTLITNKTEGIIVTEDITLTTTKTLLIDFKTTIYGNGKKLIGPAINDFVHVTTNNVKFANLTFENAQKYVIVVSEVKGVYLEDVKFKDFGDTNLGNMLKGDFSAAVFVDRSEVVINNIEFLTGGLVGVRLDQQLDNEGKTILKLYGEFKYNTNDPVLLPVGSGKSNIDGVELIAKGFDYFALPAGDIVIRRWDNQGDPVSWEIYDPEKTTYAKEEFLDLYGIGIKIDISFIEGIEFASEEGLSFVKMYIAFFKQYGIIKITNMDDVIQNKYYIVGELNEDLYGKDRLHYSLDKTTPSTTEPVIPSLPSTPGDYKIKIYIGEEFYLGHIIIKVE